MSTDYEKSVDALMKDVKELRDDMKGVIGAIKAKAEEYVGEAKDNLTESGAHRLEQVRDAAGVVGRQCQDGAKVCAAKIGEHPLASMLAALGVGLVVGALIRSHRR